MDLKRGFQIANVETVRFYIPASQIDRLSKKPELKLAEDKINGIQTFDVYHADGLGLSLAREELEKMIKK